MSEFALTVWSTMQHDEPRTLAELIWEFQIFRAAWPPGDVPENVDVAVREAIAELLSAGRVEKVGDRYRWRPAPIVAELQGRMF